VTKWIVEIRDNACNYQIVALNYKNNQ